MNTLRELVVRMFHVGPIATMALVKTITLSTIYCSLMWWPPAESFSGLFCLTSFLCSSGLVMYNFFSALTVGPGFLPQKWHPTNPDDYEKLQFCHICQGYKAPRAHHCRKCGHCVLKMDHHCPWINNCVGHRNHSHFVAFLVFAILGCSQGAIILGCSLYRAMFRSYYLYYKENVPIVYLGVYGIVWVLFSIGCAVGVVLGVSVLLYYQLKTVLRNQTGIEDWIVEKAQYRRKRIPSLPPFTYPYNFGWKQNFLLVINVACEPIGDGISWPVLPGCDQYTLTIEQISQKEDKRKRAKEYVIVEEYSGSWCPISKGCGTFWRPPISDESRIPLKKDERVKVTRWKKYWLYGVLLVKDASGRDCKEVDVQSSTETKGWFPRRCALEIIRSSSRSEDESGDDESPPPPVRRTKTKKNAEGKKQN